VGSAEDYVGLEADDDVVEDEVAAGPGPGTTTTPTPQKRSREELDGVEEDAHGEVDDEPSAKRARPQ
jgi:hypothetical protein